MAGKITIDRVLLLAVGMAVGWLVGRGTGTTDPEGAERIGTESRVQIYADTVADGDTEAQPPSPTGTGAPARVNPLGSSATGPAAVASTPRTLPEAMEDELRSSDMSRRAMHFVQNLDRMTAADAPAIAAVFRELKREGLTFDEGNFFVQRWGEIDAPAAVAYVKEHGDFGFSFDSMEMVFTGWAMAAPDKALEWVLDNPGSEFRSEALKGLVRGWARSDPEAATEMVFGVLSGDDLARGAEMVTWQMLYDRGMENTIGWFEGIPATPETEEARSRVFKVLKERQMVGGTADGRAWIAETEASFFGG